MVLPCLWASVSFFSEVRSGWISKVPSILGFISTGAPLGQQWIGVGARGEGGRERQAPVGRARAVGRPSIFAEGSPPVFCTPPLPFPTCQSSALLPVTLGGGVGDERNAASCPWQKATRGL